MRSRRTAPHAHGRSSTHKTLGAVLALGLLIGAFLAPAAVAQETTATIRGTVVDADGSPVGGAKVEVLDQRNGNIKSFTTNDSGVFLATRLEPGGPYMVIVDDRQTASVASVQVADIYNLRVTMDPTAVSDVMTVTASRDFVEVATGPAATFDSFQLETSVNFQRDIKDAYSIDPRVSVDSDGFSVNCAGKHPRFNSVTLDGVSQDDRFGLNSNGYSTAVGMPFPYDAIAQVAVEMAPADVKYGSFSACTVNAVTKSGSNEFHGNVFYEYTSDSLRGDSIGGDDRDFSSPSFDSTKLGLSVGGRILEDRLHFFTAYEQTDTPRFLGIGYSGSGNGVERPWFSQAEHDRIVAIANNVYNYDPGGQPNDGVQEEDKPMVRLDWNLNPRHNLAFIYNYYDGFQDRASDGDSNEFEFANHFYVKGAESETFTGRFSSQWTDSFSTELFVSSNTMDDSQVTVGPKDFGDFQISIGNNTVYLGADDSRQANSLNTDTTYFKLSGQYLLGRNVLTAGYEREENEIFNIFVQHSRGGEYDFFDDSSGNPAFCAALTAQGRLDHPDCELSGIDRYELGRPSRIYYGSGGGTNVATDAAATFSNTLNSLYLQDEIFFDEQNLTLVAGLRYEWFSSSDRPNFNPTFTAANNGLRNDANIDGLDLLMPRIGATWNPQPRLSIRGSIGRYSGGNPNVWISNAWSNDGLTNVQVRLNNFGADRSVLDGSIPLTGNRPGYDVPQELFDDVANTTPDNASDSGLVLIDPNYKQPNEWKYSLGMTYRLTSGLQVDFDYLHTELQDSAYYVDISQAIVGTTTIGAPIYDYVNGEDNFMLTNSKYDASSDIVSLLLSQRWDWGLDTSFGYAYVDGEDISPMTSAVASSNFTNLALTDLNNPRPGKSNYVTPHRFTLRASYGADLISDLETRVTIFAFAAEGQPQSWGMSSSDLEGDGFFGRHLLYVPDGPSDPNVVFDGDFETEEFFAWVDRKGLGRGKIVKRNSQHSSWSNRLDLSLHQEFPIYNQVKGRFFVRVYNFANLLNDDWGKITDAQFFTPVVVDASVNDQGQYVFEEFNDVSVNDLLENRSLWETRFGLEVRF